jgi:hypothetical protein
VSVVGVGVSPVMADVARVVVEVVAANNRTRRTTPTKQTQSGQNSHIPVRIPP